jgi:molybdate transport system ATP-binding protein
VLLDQGRVVAAGLCPDLLTDLSLPLAASPHAVSVLQAHVTRHDLGAQITTLAIDGQEWQIPAVSAPTRTTCRLRVMASDVGLARRAPQGTTILNMPQARIIAAKPLPETGQINVALRLGEHGLGQTLMARITRKSWESLAFQPGDNVVLLIKGVGLVEPD